MRKQIRFGMFETNSSSVHSLTIVNKEEFEKFKRGELVWDKYNDELVEAHKNIVKDEDSDEEDDDYEEGQYQDYNHLGGRYYETFTKSYKTKNGDEIVAFGYYGQDN